MKYNLDIFGIKRELELFPINKDVYIAGFIMFGDVELTVKCAEELIKIIPEHDLMITAETKGIPLLYEMARQQGADNYIVARKSQKLYMKDTVMAEVDSITTENRQSLFLSGDDAKALQGKRVVLIDDVISTGNSIKALANLVDMVGGTVVGTLAVLAEGDAIERDDIKVLQHLPLFDKNGNPLD
ncbi:MAG: adenine phosphoribosyltransferase [Clostridiales Family XIII bacterium]|jgi:adenine phosphoribosyltransferase|nr:adenine phosphoribosyltransferase [Clostridiales Family XIII bacterium]